MPSTAEPVRKKKRELKKSVIDHRYRDCSRAANTLMGDACAGVREDRTPSKLHGMLSAGAYARPSTQYDRYHHGRLPNPLAPQFNPLLSKHQHYAQSAPHSQPPPNYVHNHFASEHIYNCHQNVATPPLDSRSALRNHPTLERPDIIHYPPPPQQDCLHPPSHDTLWHGEEQSPPNQGGEITVNKELLKVGKRKPPPTESPFQDERTPQFLEGFKNGSTTVNSCQHNEENPDLAPDHKAQQSYPPVSQDLHYAQPVIYSQPPPSYFHNHSASDHSCYTQQQLAPPTTGPQNALHNHPTPQGSVITHPGQWLLSFPCQHCLHPSSYNNLGHSKEQDASTQRYIATANNEVFNVDATQPTAIQSPSQDERTRQFLEDFKFPKLC